MINIDNIRKDLVEKHSKKLKNIYQEDEKGIIHLPEEVYREINEYFKKKGTGFWKKII